MTPVAYLIRTSKGGGDYPQIVDRLTFDDEVARKARELGSEVEPLVTMSEAYAEVEAALAEVRQ
jgi:hypothetical protein